MDQLQWQGGHIGAAVFFDAPGAVPHGWLILEKRLPRANEPAIGDRDGQWHGERFIPQRYATRTGDNGEADLGADYAISTVQEMRREFAHWATRREKPHDTEYLVLACYPVDETEHADGSHPADRG